MANMVIRKELLRKVTFSKDLKKVKVQVIWISEGKAFWTVVTVYAKALEQRNFKQQQRGQCGCAQEMRNVGGEGKPPKPCPVT